MFEHRNTVQRMTSIRTRPAVQQFLLNRGFSALHLRSLFVSSGEEATVTTLWNQQARQLLSESRAFLACFALHTIMHIYIIIYIYIYIYRITSSSLIFEMMEFDRQFWWATVLKSPQFDMDVPQISTTFHLITRRPQSSFLAGAVDNRAATHQSFCWKVPAFPSFHLWGHGGNHRGCGQRGQRCWRVLQVPL